jgi:uncharacterized metal-binding protein YceD (DUF177 family)
MTGPAPEFSRIISVARIPPVGTEESLTAKPDERAALAKRFDLVKLSSLTATVTVQPSGEQIIHVKGMAAADIMQQCVITLEPLPSHIDLDIDVEFVPAEAHKAGSGSPYADDLDSEIELYDNGKIDLGEIVAQHLGIAIDPYPRKPDARLPATEFGAKADMRQPFAQLADALKGKKGEE